ncbi:MAG: hypothetical protein IJO63_04875 [Bacilli bacterium]|nr:hypothetical protein [Bacilli bacterium]
MKEATGELSNLLVVTVSVAILVAFFYFTIWPLLENNFSSQTSCEKALCGTSPDANGKVKCCIPEVDASNQVVCKSSTFMCNYKG